MVVKGLATIITLYNYFCFFIFLNYDSMQSSIKKINYFKNSIDLIYACLDKEVDAVSQSRNLFKEIGQAYSSLAVPIQNHTDNVVWSTRPGTYSNCDGIASNLKYKISLSLSVADCVPVCIFDPKTKNFALLHSGWKGTSNKIANNAVKLLISKNSQVQNIKVFCGPSICQKNYEVDWDVASLFSKNNVQKKGHKFLIDIKSQIKDDLISIGLESDNIFISDQCTYQDESFRSYRREGEKVGRNIFLMGNMHGSN